VLTRIEALNYRSLRYISQQVSPFQTLVGPNGSGKSTFLDVVGFLGDMLKVGARNAVLGNGNGVVQRAVDFKHLTWMREGTAFELAVDMQLPEKVRKRHGDALMEFARYEVAVGELGKDGQIGILQERLWLRPRFTGKKRVVRARTFPEARKPVASLFRVAAMDKRAEWKQVITRAKKSGTAYLTGETGKWQSSFKFGSDRPALANLPDDRERFPAATWVRRFLMEGVQKIVLHADAIRKPSPSGSPSHFLPDGSNLPWVVHELREKDPKRFARWIAHFRTAIPDLKTVSTVERPEDRNRYIVVEYENGLKAPSWVVSDGTLRMLALTLLAYIDGVEGIYLIEEPENGIHPKAVETVYQSLSSVYGAQVLCASHSPVVLGLAKPADLLCFAKDESGATDIVRGDEHPRLKNWKGSIDLGTLFAAGVLG